MARERPVTGYGPGTFSAEFVRHRLKAEIRSRRRYVNPLVTSSYSEAHSEPLQAVGRRRPRRRRGDRRFRRAPRGAGPRGATRRPRVGRSGPPPFDARRGRRRRAHVVSAAAADLGDPAAAGGRPRLARLRGIGRERRERPPPPRRRRRARRAPPARDRALPGRARGPPRQRRAATRPRERVRGGGPPGALPRRRARRPGRRCDFPAIRGRGFSPAPPGSSRGQGLEALDFYRDALATGERAEIDLNLGRAHALAGERPEAQAALLRALWISPALASALPAALSKRMLEDVAKRENDWGGALAEPRLSR